MEADLLFHLLIVPQEDEVEDIMYKKQTGDRKLESERNRGRFVAEPDHLAISPIFKAVNPAEPFTKEISSDVSIELIDMPEGPELSSSVFPHTVNSWT